MRSIFLILCLLPAYDFMAVYGDDRALLCDKAAYDQYLEKMKKPAPANYQAGCIAFTSTRQQITSHNAKPSATFTQGVNLFSDMSDTQKLQYTGLKKPSFTNGQTRSIAKDVEAFQEELMASERAHAPLPASLNYSAAIITNSGVSRVCLPPIQNQGACGSCWAFDATAVFEFAYCKAHNRLIKFSEQQLVSCDFNNGACNGGWPVSAWNFLSSPVLSGNVRNQPFYPTVNYNNSAGYRSGINGVNFTCLATNATLWAPNSNYGMVGVSGYVTYGKVASVNVIKTALLVYGTLGTGMMVGGSFYSYRSGVYKDTNTTTNCMSVIFPATNRIPPVSLNYVNHGPVMVGYGNDATAGPFWILRNSWGTGWGEQGYMRMAAGINLCNIESYLMWVNPFY